MNAAAVLGLLATLYEQAVAAQQEVETLRRDNETLRKLLVAQSAPVSPTVGGPQGSH